MRMGAFHASILNLRLANISSRFIIRAWQRQLHSHPSLLKSKKVLAPLPATSPTSKRDMATKDQVIALHTQVNSIETQIRGMKHVKLEARVAELEEEAFGENPRLTYDRPSRSTHRTEPSERLRRTSLRGVLLPCPLALQPRRPLFRLRPVRGV